VDWPAQCSQLFEIQHVYAVSGHKETAPLVVFFALLSAKPYYTVAEAALNRHVSNQNH
jgi:hypothetical protein